MRMHADHHFSVIHQSKEFDSIVLLSSLSEPMQNNSRFPSFSSLGGSFRRQTHRSYPLLDKASRIDFSPTFQYLNSDISNSMNELNRWFGHCKQIFQAYQFESCSDLGVDRSLECLKEFYGDINVIIF